MGLLACLFGIGSLATTILNTPTEQEESPQQQSQKQSLEKRVRELPEVQTFFRIYPNVTIQNHGNSGTNAVYSFESYRPDIVLEDETVLGVGLDIGISNVPDQEDIQAGREKQVGSFYYSSALYCGPYNPEDPQRSWFPQRMWDRSRAICPNEAAAINSTLVRIIS